VSRARVLIDRSHYKALSETLERPEEVAFLYATYRDGTFEIESVEIMMGADIAHQNKVHVELADDVRARVIKTAWDTDRCLVEVHSHGNWDHAQFSATDLIGLEEWVPHVRWRLTRRPYLALVKAGETWDSLAWIDGDEPTTIEAIEVTTDDIPVETLIPTNATAAKLAAKKRRADGRPK
jgi:hypothetical protein